ncbi:MAG: hypothetical protein AABY22_35305 [Nanoarchaeota archaeon]
MIYDRVKHYTLEYRKGRMVQSAVMHEIKEKYPDYWTTIWNVFDQVLFFMKAYEEAKTYEIKLMLKWERLKKRVKTEEEKEHVLKKA